MGPDPRNFNQRVSLGRNDLLIRTFLSKRSFLLILSFVIRFAILYFSFSWLLGYQQFFLVAVPNHIILIADSAVNRILCSKQNGIKKLM
ncbi:hypothetical protein MKS08_23935 [Klebsiella sp. K4-74]|nr:hypothetical protein [Klebsiella sp. K4-74]